MTEPSLPKLVFVKRKPSSKRRRRSEIPSPPHSPEECHDELAAVETQQLLQPAKHLQPSQSIQRSSLQLPRRPRSRVMRAQNLSIAPIDAETPSVDYSWQSLQRMREAQTSRPPPSSTTEKQTAQQLRVPQAHLLPGIETTKPSPELSRTTKKAHEPARANCPAPFSAAWNPTASPDEVAIEDQLDLSFIPTLDGSNSSDEGWEASQLARGGGHVSEQDYRYVVRHTEEATPTKGRVAKLQSELKLARKEWECGKLTAEEAGKRANRAAEDAKQLMEDAEKVAQERQAVVSAYEDVVLVFRRVCEILRKKKETIQGYRKTLLQGLENEAKEAKVRLLGGEDEFGRSISGRLADLEGDGDDDGDGDGDVVLDGDIVLDVGDTEDMSIDFDAEKMMDEVIEAMNKWKKADKDGYANGFGARGGGRVVGRLGLALPNTAWIKKLPDSESWKAALETGEVGKVIAAEIRAKWEPRRKNGFRKWRDVSFDRVAMQAVIERYGWEVDVCVNDGDRQQAERCIRGCLEVGRCGIDPGVRACLNRLRDILGEPFCTAVEEEITGIEVFQRDRE